MIKPIQPKRSGLQVIEEGNGTFCAECGSTMQRKYRLFGGFFQFGKILYCHNKQCKCISTIVQQPLSGSPEGSPKSCRNYGTTSDNGKRCLK